MIFSSAIAREPVHINVNPLAGLPAQLALPVSLTHYSRSHVYMHILL